MYSQYWREILAHSGDGGVCSYSIDGEDNVFFIWPTEARFGSLSLSSYEWYKTYVAHDVHGCRHKTQAASYIERVNNANWT